MAVKVQREKVEQAHGVAELRRIGADVYVSGTRRKRGDHQGTMQTPGIPDVEAFMPPRAQFCEAARLLLKWEAKAPGGGRLSRAQGKYQRLCANAGIAHVVGDYNALIAWLIVHNYSTPEQYPTYRLPKVAL